MIQRIICQTLLTSTSCLTDMVPVYPFYPWVNVRTLNYTDCRSASFYAQRDIPRKAVAGLFGWLPMNTVAAAVPVSKRSALCWGQTLWMAAMHLHSKRSGNAANQRLRALARVYRFGASPEAALLQTIGDHTFTRPAAFERFWNGVISAVKPLLALSVYRGVSRYLQQGGRRRSLLQEISRARKISQAALQELREQARHGQLVNVRACHTWRFHPDHQRLSWIEWIRAFWTHDTQAYAGIRSMADGTYIVTTDSSHSHMRHAILYIRSNQGQRGAFFDPNAGLELAQGQDHWKALIPIAGRCSHNIITLTQLKRRRLWDLSSFDIRRRFAELFC